MKLTYRQESMRIGAVGSRVRHADRVRFANASRTRFLQVTVALALLVLAPSAGRAAAFDKGSLASSSEDPAVQALAAEWYAGHYNVSVSTAYQRLQIQDAAIGVIENVAQALGPQYGGAWFDPSDQGRLKVAVVSSQDRPGGAEVEQATKILDGSGLDGYTDFVSVASSASDLDAIHAKADESLADLIAHDKVETYVNYALNKVVVKTATDLTSSDDAEVASAVDAPTDGSIARRDTNEPELALRTQSCAFLNYLTNNELFCDPPLRGGPTIGANNGLCTGGFIVWNTQRTTPYLLTAGHCIEARAGFVWTSRFSDGSQHNIGHGHSHTFSIAGDYGLIEIDNPSGWGVSSYPSSRVWVGQSDGGGTVQDSTYAINGGVDAIQGHVVCMSSALPLPPSNYHTSCGQVQGGLHTRSGVGGLFEASYCAVDGASGGPVYKDHNAHGTHVGANPNNACDAFFEPQSTSKGDSSHPFVF